MARSNESIFASEFKAMMNGRKSLQRNFNLVDLPLPALKTMSTGSPKGHMAVLKNIKEPFFERLNQVEVQLVGRTSLVKRQVLSDGTFRKNKEGHYEVTHITVPHTHVAVLAPISIGLTRFVEVKGKKVEHKVKDGFRYVDYTEHNGVRKYIYIIPREYAYRLELCALVITPNKRRIFYKGAKLALQNGNYLYLYVIPHKYRDSLDVRVLGVKSHFDFNQEVTAILAYWTHLGVIFNPQLTALTENINGANNLGVMDLEGTVLADDYRSTGVSMAEEKADDFQNFDSE